MLRDARVGPVDHLVCALKLLTLFSALTWMQLLHTAFAVCRVNKCEIYGRGNVQDGGCIVSAGHGDRWTNIVLLGEVGHWSWSTILHCY